jgi:hypothetical protein
MPTLDRIVMPVMEPLRVEPLNVSINWNDPELHYSLVNEVVWEPEITAIRCQYTGETSYTRRWAPTSGVEYLNPQTFNEMAQHVDQYAVQNGMPHQWSVSNYVSYPNHGGIPAPTYQQAYYDNSRAWVGQPTIHAASPSLTAEEFNRVYLEIMEGVLMAGTWATWNDTSSTATSSNTAGTSDTAWYQWTVGTATSGNHATSVRVELLTQEQMDAAREASESRRERLRVQQEEKRQAKIKSEKLLLSLLSEKQKKEYAEKRTVTVRLDNKEFTIHEKWSGNLHERDLETGKKRRLCVVPVPQIPLADQMAGQVLHLMNDADALVSRANVVN